jgi:hypothetical protein
MSIIVSKEGGNAIKIDKAVFKKEGHLQEFIQHSPDSIPLYEIQEDKKLFVVAREFPTESGPIDAMGLDRDGDIYIIETKLFKNPDKRTVIAQVLDYGASLWKHCRDFDAFTTKLDEKVQFKFNVGFEEKIKEVFDLEDENFQTLRESMKTNLQSGNIKFVILMDSLDERLKDLILYVNHHSQFDIYAVQLEYYKFEEYEVVIPKLFGDVEKVIDVAGPGKPWTKIRFIQDSKERIHNKYAYQLLFDIYDFTEKKADLLEFGTGKGTGSITFKFKDLRAKSGVVSVFTVYSDGRIQFRFGNIRNGIGDKDNEIFNTMLSKIIQNKIWNENDARAGKISPTILLEEAFPKKEILESFKSAVLEFMNLAKKDSKVAQQVQ